MIDYRRYQRQISLHHFGIEAQQRLFEARVVVVGAGGLGSVLLLHLAAAGVGNITIIDDDRVELTNLHRQVVFTEDDIGHPKAQRAAMRLQQLNSEILVTGVDLRLHAGNAIELLRNADLVVDCSDNFETRYLVNDACCVLDIALVSAAVQARELSVAAYNVAQPDGTRSADLRAIFPDDSIVARYSCARDGIIASVCAVAAALMTDTTLELLGHGTARLVQHVFYMSLDSLETRLFELNADLSNRPPHTLNVEAFERYYTKATKDHASDRSLPETVSAQELQQRFDAMAAPLVLQLHGSPSEVDLLPFATLCSAHECHLILSRLATGTEVVICCTKGKRSTELCLQLQPAYPGLHLKSLHGGLEEWQRLLRRTEL